MKFEVEKDWVTKSGLRAVVTMSGFGHRCGYVGVPNKHSLYGAHYDNSHPAIVAPDEDEPVGKRGIITLLCANPERMTSPELAFDVHGSITYSGNGDGKHPVESDLWWFGYDCAHNGDGRSPVFLEQQRELYPDNPIMWHDDGVFRSLEYCIYECESLARQIVERTIIAA